MALKRLLDLALALMLFVATAPLQAGVAALIALELGRPTLFSQLRMGRGGKPFRVFKFRSMRPQPAEGPALSDEERVSPIGRVIRRFRLDELPQTLLILTGQMSLVGPRPLYPTGHAPENDRLFRYRHRVRPGMTGWAQVNGNILLNEREKLALDAVYVSRVSPTFDLRILWMTVLTLLQGERRREVNIERALVYADRIDRNS